MGGPVNASTVVITCFEYGRFLPEAVASALSQAGQSPSVVVVDDGSRGEETLRALEELPAEVELVRQGRAGVAAARNAGLARVQTPYAIVLDADDRLAPGALPALGAELDADERLGYAYGHMEFFGVWEGVIRFPPFDPYKLLYRHIVGLSALMRRELVADTGGFDPAFDEYEDWELWVHALAHDWRGRQVDRVTLEYRRHPGASKQAEDRSRYRRFFSALRDKHADLYARRGQLAADAGTSLAERLAYRLYWGPRPIPASVETALYRRRWTRS
jgi:glycosyltransferase involved in cell wall biosynthesis